MSCPQACSTLNPLNRYLINSLMLPSLKRDPDGGLTLYLVSGSLQVSTLSFHGPQSVQRRGTPCVARPPLAKAQGQALSCFAGCSRNGLFPFAMQVALAGSVELICAVGLTLGLFTRPVALLGSVYLLMSMLWGGHFQIGYVWALPEGGYEFGVFGP
jgi:uncharacterized membrane protein YphA (DoxX/SURF4 family)